MTKTILLLAALDTKGADAEYVRARIESRGHRVLLVDLGVMADAPFETAITSVEVARAGGRELSDLRVEADRSRAVEVMAAGARAVVAELHRRGEVDGVFALGGGAGTTIGSTAMRDLPLGLPKIILSTVAAGDTTRYLGTSDIILFPSMVDVAGMNRVSRTTYARAADAMAGMLDGMAVAADQIDSRRSSIAATMFGVTTPCILRAQQSLEELNHEVVVFHATGTGGKTMERLIQEGYFDAVLDLTTTEWADEIVGGILAAGPDRLDAALAANLPQVVSVGATDMVNFGRPDTIPARFLHRVFYQHNAENTLMRTTAAEAADIGRAIGAKINKARRPVAVLLPARGVSALDAPGQPFEDLEARSHLAEALTSQLDNPQVSVQQLDLHINDPEFADAVVSTLTTLLATTESKI